MPITTHMQQVKKTAFFVARLIIALAGIGFIIWSTTWTDHVIVPSGVRLPNGNILDKATAYPITTGNGQAFEANQPVTIVIERGTSPVSMDIPVEPRGQEPDNFQFKPGIVKSLREANLAWVLLGLVLLGPIYPIQGYRWGLLLRARGLHVSFGKSFRLVMVGSFFNYCMPGSTGGDVVKAYYAAKGSGRNADAIMSVLFDRIAGLLGLIILGSVAGLFMLGDPIARQVTISIWLLAVILIAAGLVYFVPSLRRRFGVDWMVAKLPGHNLFASIDQAAVAYRNHKNTATLAVGISILVHMLLITSVASAGYSLGIGHGFGMMAAVLPILFVVTALPISYQGLGIVEGLGLHLLVQAPLCTANQLIGMFLLFRVYMVVYGLLGSLFLLGGDIHMHPQDATDTAQNSPVAAVTT